MPEKKGVKVPKEADVLKLIEKCKKANTKAWIDNTKTEPFFAQEVKGGKITSTNKNEKFDYTEYTLSNGAKVIIKKTDFKNDEILVSAQSAGGTSMYEDKDMINAQFAANIIDQCGIGTYDHSQLMKFMKGKTSQLFFTLTMICDRRLSRQTRLLHLNGFLLARMLVLTELKRKSCLKNSTIG